MIRRRLALVSNTFGTVIAEPTEPDYGKFIEKGLGKIENYEAFMKEYNETFREPPKTEEDWERVWEIQVRTGIPNIPYPNSRKLINRLKKQGVGLVIYAGAPPERTKEIYKGLDIEIDGAFKAGNDRNSPGTYIKLRDELKELGFDPIAYLTHADSHAFAAARAWGKGLVCGMDLEYDGRTDIVNGERTTIGKLYTFDWNNIGFEWEMKKVNDFLLK